VVHVRQDKTLVVEQLVAVVPEFGRSCQPIKRLIVTPLPAPEDPDPPVPLGTARIRQNRVLIMVGSLVQITVALEYASQLNMSRDMVGIDLKHARQAGLSGLTVSS